MLKVHSKKQEVLKFMASKQFTKYRNVKTVIDGHKFDSKGEGNRYCELLLLQRIGRIHNLEMQVPFTLMDAFKGPDGKTVKAIKIVVDFGYTENGKEVVEDFKSPATRTRAFLLKKKLFQARYPHIEFRESGAK